MGEPGSPPHLARRITKNGITMRNNTELRGGVEMYVPYEKLASSQNSNGIKLTSLCASYPGDLCLAWCVDPNDGWFSIRSVGLYLTC